MPAGPVVGRRGADRCRGGALPALVAAGVATLLLAACGGSAHTRRHSPAGHSDGITGTLPAPGRPARGGTIAVGQIARQTPSDIFPLVDSASCTTPTLNFVQNQYIPLYAGPNGAEPAIDERLSAAEPPRYSHADRTVTITLKRGLKWSDGKPVQAQDIVFYLDLLKAALKETSENWCQYSPGEFPENVSSWTTVGLRTLVLHLTHAVNPSWFTTNQLQDVGAGVYPLPSQDWDVDSASGEHVSDWATDPADALRIYSYLHAQGRNAGSFSSNPLWKVVDGPFRLRHFDSSSGSYELVPNNAYSLTPQAKASEIAVRTYANSAALLAALRSGLLDVASIDSGTQLGAIRQLRRHGYSVFGGPEWGWFGGVINYRDRTDHFNNVIAQRYMRGVLAELVDQPAIIKRVYHGWAVPAYGPVPTEPRSPYVAAAAARASWPYNPSAAASTLRAHGWAVKPGGQTTCRKPGRGAGECGAGIPRGTPI